MPIRVLSEQVAAQIAAGEVVERPASVVKELLENALDAGAAAITVEIREGGRRLIRISDDGSGIPSDEVALAFHRHSTSKLHSAADLDAIRTLGFRGEALASVASVARVTMVTRASGEAAGTALRVDGGRIVDRQVVGAPQGTMVAVENLFYNVPARQKFLRAVPTEKRHIDALVSRYAMAYPAVRLRLTHDNRLVFQSPGGGLLKDALVQVFGLETAKQMLEIGRGSEDQAGAAGARVKVGSGVGGQPAAAVRVFGYTGAPLLHRANRSQITLFVNGRWIQDGGLTYAVVQAYHTMLMTGRYPVSLILIEMPPEQVDVNVHPTKAEVRFRDKDAVFDAVQRAVRRALLESGATRPGRLPPPPDRSSWSAEGRPALRAALATLRPAPHFQPEMEMPGGTPGRHAEGWAGSPSGDTTSAVPRPVPMLRVVGQIGASYIVAEGPAGLVVIDQHAAHERVLYEQYMSQREEGVPTQALLEPVPVDLPPDRASLLEEHLEVLQRLGFVVEPFGGSTYVVRGIPALLGETNPAAALEAVADDLERGDRPLEGAREEQIIARVCKTAAVKAGHVLTAHEMSTLVRQLERCASPHTCPHGRPTMIEMSADQLARQFERI